MTQKIVCKVGESDSRADSSQLDILQFGAAHAVLNTAKNVFNRTPNLGLDAVDPFLQVVKRAVSDSLFVDEV